MRYPHKYLHINLSDYLYTSDVSNLCDVYSLNLSSYANIKDMSMLSGVQIVLYDTQNDYIDVNYDSDDNNDDY